MPTRMAAALPRFHCHHLARSVALFTEQHFMVFLVSDTRLGPILLRSSVAVAGVLARPVTILLETPIGAQENNARESSQKAKRFLLKVLVF